jgi:hypothetical protein
LLVFLKVNNYTLYMSFERPRSVESSAEQYETHPITVDLDQSLSSRIHSGNYDDLDKAIMDVYPHKLNRPESLPVSERSLNYEAVLIPREADMTDEALAQKLAELGLEPPQIEHLLALGAQHQDVQREHAILGSPIMKNGERVAPTLTSSGSTRSLEFLSLDNEEESPFGARDTSEDRFLAVRKK